MSNEYQLKNLNDPINYQVSLREDNEEISEIPLRYMTKERKIKEQDAFGSYRFYSNNLKKRTNPTEEYYKKLEEELLQKKKLLSEYQMNGGHLTDSQLKSLAKSENFRNSKKNYGSAFNILEVKDINDEEEAKYSHNLSANENIIRVIDAQVDLLKKKSNDQFKQLTKSNENSNSLYKTQKIRNLMDNNDSNIENGLNEPKVDAQFLAANDNRVQTLKHVYTQQKPEYIPLEELEKLRLEHRKELLDIEDDYFGRKNMTQEELNKMKEEKEKLLKRRQLNNKIKRPGYNNDNPLDENDNEYIKKYNNYLINKYNNYDKLGYEEEWNYTKVKSQNANGVVDRTDGLPGYLGQDDYKLYYYDIIEDRGELNFERPLKIHKHIGKENTIKRTFRNEPGYENTKGKLYRTASAPDFNSLTNQNINNNINHNNLNIINESKNRDILNNVNEINTNKSINMQQNNINNNSKTNTQFMKLIFSMLNKNKDGEVPKNKIISEMKLDENAINELGFKDKNDIQNKLNNFPTKKPEYMNEEEFFSFLLPKENNEDLSPNNLNSNLNEDKLFQTVYSPQSQTIPINQKTILENQNEILPGMSTSYFDFLKNPSTTARLKHINKTLKGKRSQSALDINENKYKTLNRSFNFKTNKNFRNNKLNKSYDNEKNINTENYNNRNNNLYNTIDSHFNIKNYNKKSDLNFTIPKPFEFLKEDYHGKKLLKMKEILEERKKNEDEIFKHVFHANPLNKKMFDTKGDLRNVIEREKSAREFRLNKKRQEIISNMKPFSFYDADFKSFVDRKNQECLPPEFIPFKANPIKYKSQANMYEGLINNSKEARQERIHQRALQTYKAASLPKRMEMHEKQRKLQEQEQLIIEDHKNQMDKKRRMFKANKAPKFQLLHEKFINILEKKKKSAHPTVPKPFHFNEPRKKADLCQFLDFENDPNSKNPQKIKNIDVIRKRMQRKPKIEPPSTKSLKLLMDTRRKELENRKFREESMKLEDEKRRERQKRLNKRVRSSSVMQTNKKQLEENRRIKKQEFIRNMNENKNNYKNKLELMYRNADNRPLLMETQVRKKSVENMKQDDIS